ncbi:MAG TPA: hypothetical protein VE990_09130, partial [Acidimicrobiales bacterium]|nr:hypothetical protein [Acidimicrobiales bacterium]
MSALLGRDGRVGLVVAVAGVLVAAALILFGPRGNVLPTAALASNVGALPSLPGTSVSSGSAADLGTPHIPVLGTYHFQTVSQDSGAAIGGTATRTSDRTLTIRQVGVSGSDVSLQYHYGGSLQGDNSDTDIWRTTGIFLSQTSAGPGDCRFSPPLVTTPFPLAVGRTWSSGAACHIPFSV